MPVASALIVLVNKDPRVLRLLEDQLSACGYLVAVVTSFEEATSLLESATPDLLIVDLHLLTYNGLHLAIRSRTRHPDVPVIVTHTDRDAFAEAEARRYGASFASAPLDNPTFLSEVHQAVARRLERLRPLRRWNRRPVSAVVEVNVENASAQIMDVSYGGMRLAFQTPCAIPAAFDVSVPTAGVTLRAQRVWTSRAGEPLLCGAALVDESGDQWRRFVDMLERRQGRGH